MNLDRLELLVFESAARRNFVPLSLTRPTFDFLLGSRTLLERTESRLGKKAATLIVPKYLEKLCQETHPGLKINQAGDSSILVNSLISPRYELVQEVERALEEHVTNFAVLDEKKNMIFAVLEKLETNSLPSLTLKTIRKRIATKSLEKPLIEYPWELVARNSFAIEDDYLSLGGGVGWKREPLFQNVEIQGRRNLVSESALVEPFVTIDTRAGPVIIDDAALIQSFSRIKGPCYIGKSCIIKGAKIGEGTTLGKECRVGGEVEASIIHDFTNKNHDGFLGHSVVGSWVNLGAMTTNSDLKNTYGKVKANVGAKRINTGYIKVGCFLSDMCKSSIGTMILSGKSVGVCSNIFGIVSENVPSFTFWADTLSANRREVILESAIETQSRMMERRNVPVSLEYLQMIRTVFKLTTANRRNSGVKLGKFNI